MEAADFYTDLVVPAYAKLKSQSFEADRYSRFVRATGQPALEIGCGDSQPLLSLIEAGLVVEGLDSSADMLDRCRANAAASNLSVTLHHQRVETMQLGRTFESIYLAGPTFNLVPDDHTAGAALRSIRRHLSRGGAALVPLWIPDRTPNGNLGEVREARDDDGSLLRYTALEETWDARTRLRITSVRYERIDADGERTVADRDWTLHWHRPDDFARLCAEAGLSSTITDPSSEPGAEFTAVLRPI